MQSAFRFLARKHLGHLLAFKDNFRGFNLICVVFFPKLSKDGRYFAVMFMGSQLCLTPFKPRYKFFFNSKLNQGLGNSVVLSALVVGWLGHSASASGRVSAQWPRGPGRRELIVLQGMSQRCKQV